MSAVLILATFDAYPEGAKVTFVEGTEPDVTEELAELLVRKGLARRPTPAAAAAAPEAEPAAPLTPVNLHSAVEDLLAARQEEP